MLVNVWRFSYEESLPTASTLVTPRPPEKRTASTATSARTPVRLRRRRDMPCSVWAESIVRDYTSRSHTRKPGPESGADLLRDTSLLGRSDARRSAATPALLGSLAPRLARNSTPDRESVV